MEVHRDISLYTIVDELMRWQSILDTTYKQYLLDKRHKDNIYSQ